MSWVDKAHKKAKTEKTVREVMNHPLFREEFEKREKENLVTAFGCFCLIGADYMFRNFGCKETGTKKFLDFVKSQLGYVTEDEEYFRGMNEVLVNDVGFDVMEYMGIEFGKGDEDGKG